MIGVLGATGRVGRHVAAGLAERGVEARALVRRPEPRDLPLPAVHTDLSVPATLAPAFDGVERLLLLTAHGPDQDLREAAAIDAAVAAGVQRIVKISGGAPTLGPNGTTADRRRPLAQRAAHRALGPGLRVPAAVLLHAEPARRRRPRRRGDRRNRGAVRARADRDGRRPRRRRLRDRGAARRATEPARWQLTGPRPVTFGAIARRISGARYVNVPVKLAARSHAPPRSPAAEIDHATRMAAYFASGADSAATDHVLRLTGRAPRSIEAFLDEHASAFSPTTRLARALSQPPKELI